MKKTLCVVISVLFVLALVAGCGNSNQPTPTKATTESTAPGVSTPIGPELADVQELTACFASDPDTMDPGKNSSVDGAVMISNAFAGLYGYAYDESGKLIVVADCAQEVVEPTALPDGKQQYVITLKPDLKWSDGEPLKASDFVYAWNRAVDPATASDYQYIFFAIDGYSAKTPNLNVTADDAAGTVTVVTSAVCPYFDQLMAFPEYFPVRKDIIDANGDAWATSPETYISNGAFRMTEWNIGDKIVFEKNLNYWDVENVKLDKLIFALSDDDDAIFANFSNGTYQYTTSVAVSQIPILKNDPSRMNVDFFIGDYVGTYYLEFNVNQSFKPGLNAPGGDASAWEGWTEAQNEDVRHALALIIDRNYIVNEVTQGGQTPATGFVPKGMNDGTGAEFRTKAGDWWSVDPAQHQANVDEAITLLKKYYKFDEATGKFTDFPTFMFSANPTSGNLAIAAAVQSMWSEYGIECTVDQRTWAVIQTALTEGDFTMSRLGWIADYNDPDNFLNMFLSSSGNNHPRLGKEGVVSGGANFGENNDQPWSIYDEMYEEVAKTSDLSARADILYQMENMLRDTYACVPLYYYTNPYLKTPSLQNFVYTPLGIVLFKTAYFTK